MYGPVLNGLDNERVPGGSSGGSAVSVQNDLCHISIGSDTGGSVRQPASFCGIIGFKPTYSRISRYGLIAYASSFDCIGILGKNLTDIALVLETMAGKDDNDCTSSMQSIPEFSKFSSSDKKLKIGYIKESIHNKNISVDVKSRTLSTIEKLKNEGHLVTGVDFPLLDYVLPAYYILTTSEASSNLSRFDGVKYGYRSRDFTDLKTMYKKSRSEGFGSEVKKRILLGTFALSANYYDAYYFKAQKVRKLIRDQTKKLLQKYDYLLTPTSPTTAFKLNEHIKDPLQMYLSDLLTVQASVAGIPAISIPNGNDSQGLPVGLQVMTDDFKEKDLFSFANYLLNLN